jgi:predicted lipoprotein with Yx(FWY)xxD motif
MKSRYMILSAMVALTILASACATQATPTTAPAAQVPDTQVPATQAPAAQASATQAPPPATPSGPAMVNLGKSDQLGSFLVDDKGMTLYLFTKDSPGTSTCYDKCAAAWPALLTAGNAAGGAGVDATKFGTTTRTDGSTQVTYNGWPLYFYAKDKQPGDTTGQAVGSVWYLVSATGDAIK